MKNAILAALMLSAAVLPSAAAAQQITQTIAGTRLDISATGEVTRVPDVAIISAGVVSRSATASAALDSGAVRALAIAGEQRLASRLAIPTLKEAGIDLVVEHWWGVLAPAGLPPEIAARLTGDLKAILDSLEFATRLAPLGVTASHASPAQFQALIESDTARWAEIVKSVGISVP